MKLAKLLHPEKPTILWHDLIGKVYWGDYENVGVNYLYHGVQILVKNFMPIGKS